MLTCGSSLEPRLEVVDAGVDRRRATTSAGTPIRSQCAWIARVPASKAHGFAASPPPAAEVVERRASGRGPAARGATGRARSVTRSTRSQSWEPSNSGSKPPTSSTSERRSTLRWQVYICVRIRSGDQSGLKNGPRVVAGLVDLVFVGVDVVGLGVAAIASSTSSSASGWRASSWSSRATNSPSAIASASLEAATMPPFSARVHRPGSAGPRAAPRVEHLAHAGRGRAVVDQAELPVAEGLAADRAQHRRQHVGRRLEDRREDREAGRRHGFSPARGARSRASAVQTTSPAPASGSAPTRSSIRAVPVFEHRHLARAARVRRPGRSAGRAGGGSPRAGGRLLGGVWLGSGAAARRSIGSAIRDESRAAA